MTDAQARNLGALIRRARLAKGLSFRELSARTGVPLGSVKRLEDGIYNEPSPAKIARIAEALEIDPAQIDEVTHEYLADSMPSTRTYLRSKEKLSPEGMDALERALDEVRADDAKRRAAQDGAQPTAGELR